MKLHEKLKYARKRCGLLQWSASEETGLTQKRISAFENGKSEPKFSELVKLAKIYRKPVEWFLNEDEPKKPVMLHCDIN